jgi:predicted solute-binding protein
MNIRISIINYSNTIPFIFGLESSEYIKRNSTFFYHYPAQGVELLKIIL